MALTQQSLMFLTHITNIQWIFITRYYLKDITKGDIGVHEFLLLGADDLRKHDQIDTASSSPLTETERKYHNSLETDGTIQINISNPYI